MLPGQERDGRHRHRAGPSDPEKLLRAVSPALGELVTRLRKRYGGQALRAVRRLYKMYLNYPTDVLVDAVTEAVASDLHDLGRIDRMVLERIRGEYFRLPRGGRRRHAQGAARAAAPGRASVCGRRFRQRTETKG